MSRRSRTILVTSVASLLALMALTWAGWQLSKSRSYQLFGELVTRVETADSVVALTFDDGPVPGYTDSVLSVLADRKVSATFFVVGAGLAKYPELARRITAGGHELGNHSYSHRALVLTSPAVVREEIHATDSLIRCTGQSGEIHVRPPYAKRLVILPWLLSRENRKTVLWDLEPDSYPDLREDPARIVDYVVRNVRPGSIILLHVETSGRTSERAALPALIDALQRTGYRFVTVSELLHRAASAEA